MPFPRLTKSKHVPEKDDRPLLYAQQSPSTPSLAPSVATATTTATLQPYHEPDQSTSDNDTSTIDDTPEAAPESETDSFTRPQTPPQGSNYNPWSSYRDLPPDHPVFRYPDEVREKMYAKGVGKCSPEKKRPSSNLMLDHILVPFPFFFRSSELTEPTKNRPRGQSRNGPRSPGQGVRRQASREDVLEARDEYVGRIRDDEHGGIFLNRCWRYITYAFFFASLILI